MDIDVSPLCRGASSWEQSPPTMTGPRKEAPGNASGNHQGEQEWTMARRNSCFLCWSRIVKGGIIKLVILQLRSCPHSLMCWKLFSMWAIASESKACNIVWFWRELSCPISSDIFVVFSFFLQFWLVCREGKWGCRNPNAMTELGSFPKSPG